MKNKGQCSEDLQDLMFRLQGGKIFGLKRDEHEFFSRSIICTPCGGCYGYPAAWLIAVEGTPPHGMIVYECEGFTGLSIHYITGGKSRGIKIEKDRKVIQDFFISNLEGCKGVVTIPGYESVETE